MKEPCKKCGKILGFFDRSHKIDDERLNLHYDSLCGECNGIIKDAIARIGAICEWVNNELKKAPENLENGISGVEVDLLIFTVVRGVLTLEPDYFSRKSNLNKAFLKGKDEVVDKQKDLVRLLFKILSYGFDENLRSSGLDLVRNFMAYMIQNSIFLENVELNCDVDDLPLPSNLFANRRGLLIETQEKRELITVPISGDVSIEYHVATSEIVNEVILKNVFYPQSNGKMVIITIVSQKVLDFVIRALDRFAEKTKRIQDKEKKDALEYFNDRVVEDLKKLKPQEIIETIHLDCLLLCIVKNLKSEKMFSLQELFDPKGTTIELLWAYYPQNLRNMGIDDNEKIVTYLLKNTLYTDGFSIKHGNKPSDTGWGFFTTKGYIIYFGRSRQIFFIYTEVFPNGLYNPCNRITYEDRQYLQLIMNSGKSKEGNYRELDELIFYSENESIIDQMEGFFERLNLYFQMETFLKTEKNIRGNREKYLEVKRVIDHIFADYGYLPYCIYDEWFFVQNELRGQDVLLGKIIQIKETQNKTYVKGTITYAPKIIEAFNEGAATLKESLDIKETSVAKAVLWVGLREAVIETLSEEWVRIAGEILEEGDNALAGFFRYANLKNIEPDKVYYMGLFIYHLMDRGILPKDNFLDNYEEAVRVFLECRRVIENPTTKEEEMLIKDQVEKTSNEIEGE
ncbi:MAG: hypothetical protein ACRCU3_01520 [Eubacteriaceae bacterium]